MSMLPPLSEILKDLKNKMVLLVGLEKIMMIEEEMMKKNLLVY